MKYYADMKDAPLYGLMRKSNIKTKNPLMAFYDSSWQDCPGTGRITVAYVIFYQGGIIDHSKNVPEQVAQSSAESEYNIVCTAGMT